MSETYRYDVFISYARKDGLDFSARIDEFLTNAGFKTWRDLRKLDPAQDYSSRLEVAIKESQFVVTCITPDVERDDSFVRREIQYAINRKKLLIPILLDEKAELPIHICTLTFIDFVKQAWKTACDQLHQRIIDIKSGAFTDKSITPPDDPFRDYCNLLYDQIVAYLNHTVFSLLPTQSPDALITLQAKDTPDAVPEIETIEASALPLQFFGMAGMNDLPETPNKQPKFTDFSGAFDYYDGRVLLLGDPGAGKTTTLFAFARDAVSRRLNDPSQPLPILLPVVSWDAIEKPSLIEWITSAIPAFKSKRAEIEQVIGNGRALFMLDGLDELGDKREIYEEDPETGEEELLENYDPRPLFVNMVVNDDLQNKTIISCRVKDYQDIIVNNGKIELSGAITLQPLDDEQLQIYLRDLPELWDALQNDDDLRDVARTPLLLSLFTFAFNGLDDETKALRDLSGGELRDHIFRTYIERRYKHEESKYKERGENPPFPLEQVYEVLGYVAMVDACSNQDNQVILEYFDLSAIDQKLVLYLVNFVTTLHILANNGVILAGFHSKVEQQSFKFIHLLLRDYFIYQHCVPLLTKAGTYSRYRYNPAKALGQIQDQRKVDILITSLNYFGIGMEVERRNIAKVLGDIGDKRAITPLMMCLTSNSIHTRSTVALALGKIGTPALSPLLNRLNDKYSDVRSAVAEALSIIGTPALAPLLSRLDDKNWRVRHTVAEALGGIRDSLAVEPLILRLGDNDKYVRQKVEEALRKIGTPEALQAVEDAKTKGWLD